MLGKKLSKEQWLVGAAVVALAASRLVGLLVLGARALRQVLAPKAALDAAGLSARDRFDLYADLEYAREQERTRRARRTFAPREAT
jgi:hypothetical protein